MIDLHTHTTESDGTLSPEELIDAACQCGLQALAITDHDTFAGYDRAHDYAAQRQLPLVCGIELSTAWGNPKERTVHLLGYWLDQSPTPEFRSWLNSIQAARRDRNIRLAAKLQSMGFDIRLEEVEAIGRSMAGRPHFARIMVEKGYVSSLREAFDRYLDESAPAYVDREEPTFLEGVMRILSSGGIPCLAHPVRLGKRKPEDEEAVIASMCDMGLKAIEVYHSDHSPEDTRRYLELARKYGLRITGGSDFHGENKPSIVLGRGAGNLNIDLSVLDQLRGSGPPAS